MLFKAEPDPYWRRLWTFYIYTGLRRQEALDLTWERIHLTEAGQPPHMHIIQSKRDKSRVVPLVAQAIEALGDPRDIGPVWRQVTGGRVSHKFKLAVRSAGLPIRPGCTICGTPPAPCWPRPGVDIAVIKDILGHSNISTTLIYRHAITSLLHREMSKLADQKRIT